MVMKHWGKILLATGLALFGAAGTAMAFASRKPAVTTGPLWDPVSEARMARLHPDVAQAARRFIQAAYAQGIALRVTSGYRSFAEQQALYNQGRTTPGNIVTNAPPGHSYHNWGMAVDVVEIKNGQALWNNPRWGEIARIGKSLGFEWGGDWKSFQDKPHFQMPVASLASLRAAYPSGNTPWT